MNELLNYIQSTSGYIFLSILATLITLSTPVLSMLFSIYSRVTNKINISGSWLLIIYARNDNNEKRIVKVDEYKIKQFRNKISGNIQRIYSEESEKETLRSYSFRGYLKGNELIYVFIPKNTSIKSYGACNLEHSDDYTYSGYYYPPIGKGSEEKREIILTQSLETIKDIPNLLEKISPDLKNHKINIPR